MFFFYQSNYIISSMFYIISSIQTLHISSFILVCVDILHIVNIVMLQCAYNSRACVRVGNDVSEWFPVNVGLRQGCVMSP